MKAKRYSILFILFAFFLIFELVDAQENQYLSDNYPQDSPKISSTPLSYQEDLDSPLLQNGNQAPFQVACDADIVFVVDTTGSMVDEINIVKSAIVNILSDFQAQQKNFQVGGISFGDEIRDVYSLTSDYSGFNTWVQGLQASGGDDTPENQLDALWAASEMNFRTSTKRLFILFTDAPFHTPGDGGDADVQHSYAQIYNKLQKDNVTLYGLTDQTVYDGLIALHCGQRYPLTQTAEELRKTVNDLVTCRVVILDVDGLYANNLYPHMSRYPTLYSLFKEGYVRYDDAFSQFPSITFDGHASLFTGLPPGQHGIMGNKWFNRNAAGPLRGYFRSYLTLEQFSVYSGEGTANKDLTQLQNTSTLYQYASQKNPPINSVVAWNMYTKGATKTIWPQANDLIVYTTSTEEYDLRMMNNLVSYIKDPSLQCHEIPKIITAYWGGHDHRSHTDGSSIQEEYVSRHVDSHLKKLIEALKSKNVYDFTVFLITADHGHLDRSKEIDIGRVRAALSHGGLNVYEDSIFTANTYIENYWDMVFNAEANIIKVYIINKAGSIPRWNAPPLEQDIQAVISNLLTDSVVGPEIAYILVKDYGHKTYKVYDSSTGGYKDLSTLKNSNPPLFRPVERITNSYNYKTSPDVLALLKKGTIVKTTLTSDKSDHGGLYLEESWVPLMIMGKPVKQKITLNTPVWNYDTTKIVASILGIPLPEYVTRSGTDLSPQFVAVAKSPVHLHLYDEQGRHTGPRSDGSLDLQIPSSSYTGSGSDDKIIQVLDVQSKYNIVLEAFGAGTVDFLLSSLVDDSYAELSFLGMNFTASTQATLNMISDTDFVLEIDYDGDGTIDDYLTSSQTLILQENTDDGHAYAFVTGGAGSTFTIDATASTDSSASFTLNSSVTDGVLYLARTYGTDRSQGRNIFPAKFIDAETNAMLSVALDSFELTTSYTDTDLFDQSAVEKNLSYYRLSGNIWKKVSSTLDKNAHTLHAALSPGNLSISSSDQHPLFTFVDINPLISSNPSLLLSVRVNVTDNDALSDVYAVLNGSTYTLTFDSSSGLYINDNIPSPSDDGIYSILLSAVDDNDNLATLPVFYTLDTVPPELVILSPEQKPYPSTDVPLVFYTLDRLNTVSYALDGGESTLLSLEGWGDALFGVFNITISIPHGTHLLTLVANDTAGNVYQTSLDVTVSFRNVGVSALESPLYARPGDNITFTATLFNSGNQTEDAVTADLLIDNIVVDTSTLSVPYNSSASATFLWNNALKGFHNATVSVHQLHDENFLEDNLHTLPLLITKKPTVLLVDDIPENILFNNITNTTAPAPSDNSIYQTAFQLAGFDQITWDVQLQGNPIQAILSQFPLTFWITGHEWFDTLDDRAQSELSSYLDDGGHLVLSGSALGYDIRNTTFYSDYLHTSLVSSETTFPLISGWPNDEIGQGLTEKIRLFTDENETIYNELIAPLPSATPVFLYKNEKNNLTSSYTKAQRSGDRGAAAIKAATDDYKVVYFSFDLSALINHTAFNEIIARTLYWTLDLNPPVLQSIGNQVIQPNMTLTLQLQATDEDNDPLIFGTDAAAVLPSPFFFDSSTGLFQWTPTFDDYGNYNVTFDVTDSTAFDSETITISVPFDFLLSNEIRVTQNPSQSHNPTLLLDSAGSNHIFFSDNREDPGIYRLYYTKLDSGGSTLIDDVRKSNLLSASPFAIAGAVDTANNLHILAALSNFYIKLDSSGNVLIADKYLGLDFQEYRVAIDSSSNIHLVGLASYPPSIPDYRVFYVKLDSNGNKLIGPILISDSSTSLSYAAHSPDLAIDKQNNLHVIWSDMRDDWELYYTKLDNNGTTLIPDQRISFSTPNPASAYGRILQTADQNLAIIFFKSAPIQGDLAYYRMNLDGNTLLSGILLGIYAYSILDISNDKQDNLLHIVYAKDGIDQPIYYAAVNKYGVPIFKDYEISTKATTGSAITAFSPTIKFDSQGDASVVWVDARDISMGYQREIYYRKLSYS